MSDFANFSPYTDSYQSSRPTASTPYAPLQDTDLAEEGSSSGPANPFSNPYRSPADARPDPTAVRVNSYETSLPIRMDVEAALAYSLLAFSGVILLVLEQKNDYVRFHAWQSTLLFVGMGILQMTLGFLAHWIAWSLLAISFILAVFLGFKAFRNGSSLERFMVPGIGRFAAQWTDTE